MSFWNTSRVTNMEEAFNYRRYFNEDISRWNVGKVTNMSRMFLGADHFNSDISQWDVSHVTDMSGIFLEHLTSTKTLVDGMSVAPIWVLCFRAQFI